MVYSSSQIDILLIPLCIILFGINIERGDTQRWLVVDESEQKLNLNTSHLTPPVTRFNI